jgi:predicted TPR repeat methyltransferase
MMRIWPKPVMTPPHRIAAALKPYVQPSDRILDFGCGTGLSGLALQNAGFTNIDGLDISAPMLEKAKGAGSLWQPLARSPW